MPSSAKICKKKLFFIFLVLFTTCCLVFVRSPKSPTVSRAVQLNQIEAIIHTKTSSKACKLPKLPVFSPEMMKFVFEVPPVDCSQAGPDWVKCNGSICEITEQIQNKYGVVKCSFTDVIRLDDFEWFLGQPTHSDSLYKLEDSDVVKVACSAPSRSWRSTLTGIRTDRKIFDRTSWNKLPQNAIKYNVLMLGFDSVSRNTFIRKLPKSYKYLIDELGGSVLEGYNIVGDGTPQALIPILTGKTELELPDTRKRIENTEFVNVYPFVWNDFKAAGYVTGFFEDCQETSTFTYRLNGFKEVPTDHYMRTYYLSSFNDRRKWPKLCAGDTSRHNVMFNQIRNFYAVYNQKPSFLFAFHGELSHDDYNLVGAADNDLKKLLEDLKNSKVLDNTILILMADHGHRFAAIRDTLQGKQEERLPFFSFTFPETFKRHFKQAYENFQSNVDKLTTPFDIHKTLKSVINLDSIGDADINKRAVSLFTKIPNRRSCAHARIESHWCACLEWKHVDVNEPVTKKVADALLATLNEITERHRDICEVLTLSNIHWITKNAPNEDLIKFNKNADLDGFIADLSAKMKIKADVYEVKISVLPGHSVFEASVVHQTNENRFSVDVKDISRVNMYGSQAKCVEQYLPELRKYCYCRGSTNQ